MTYLGYGFMKLEDKIFSLLWALFLEIGSDPLMMRWRLACIRGFCTDMGVECGIADAPDLLPEFLSAIGVNVKVPRLRFLFGFAFWTPGWNHVWYGILQDTLTGIFFFPKFLEVVSGRAITHQIA